jgi:DNA polymerase-4
LTISAGALYGTKSISTEHTFDQDTIDIQKLKSVLIGMVEKLAFQLRSEEWLTSTVVIKIRYANFDTETKTMQKWPIPQPIIS